MAWPLLAALGVPIVGGAMSMIGGAMSLTGGVVHAGSTIAGIAADAAGGVMGAAGGLTGGGQSGQVKAKSGKMYDRDSPQGKMIATAAKARKAKEGTSKGTGLANVKSTIDPDMMDESPTSLLPTGDESPTTLLGQILASIRGLYAPIESIASAVVSPPPLPTPPEDLIDTAKEKKGGHKEPGIVKRTFSALGTKLKDLSSSLGNSAKFIGKGLLLGGLFFLFKKYEKQITTMLAKVFETLEGWYTGMKDPDSIWNNMGSIVKDSILPFIENIVHKVMEMFVSMWNTMAEGNWWMPKMNWDTDYSPPDAAATATSSSALTTHASEVGENLGTVRGTASILHSELGFKNMSGDADQQAKTQQLVLDRLSNMYDWVVQSKGRVQWTNIGDGFTIGKGIHSLLNSNIPIEDIMLSQPIINGKLSTESDLASYNPKTIPAGLSGDIADQFRANQEMMTTSQQRLLSNIKVDGLEKNRKFWTDKFDAAKRANELLLPAQTSDSGTGQSVVVASNDNRNVNTHHGDFVFPKLDVNHSDSTARAFTEYRMA